MGDILWAHLEILQKDVDRDRSSSGNEAAANYSDSFAAAESFQRTYTQLDSAMPPLQQHQSSSSPAMNSSHGCRTSQYGGHRGNGYPPLDYMHNNNNNNTAGSTNGGSIVDSSSEYSYHALEMKYSAQMSNGRVPGYPPHHMTPGYPDSYGGDNLWPYGQMGSQNDCWHQEFSVSSSVGMTSLPPPPPPTSSSSGMHHHPVFLQVNHLETQSAATKSTHLLNMEILGESIF
jgi:hypothetical protein